MTDKTPQQLKAEALTMLGDLIPRQAEQLRAIDPRLLTYYEGLTDGDLHNLYEVLGGIKFLRILRTYKFSHKKVRHAIQLYEGRWQGDKYIDDSGGLQFSGLKGFMHYQLQPFQVFALAGLLGPMKDVDGDMRRLCTELVLYLTRKSGKTLLSAFIQFYGFFFMDSNFEGYCCANSADQAKLLYKTAQMLIRQMDPREQRIRFTASQTNWKPGQPRQASITALSAGGKTKDGLYAQLCCADEFGSADFTNGKSDMLDLVSVVQSSMGPRREPLTVITTTAGYAVNGPFIRQLSIMETTLLEELELPGDYCEPLPGDYRHALLLQPDPWEKQDEELLLTDQRIWRKANPMIGISVQPAFYQQEAYKALQNQDNRKEFVTKLVNVYRSGNVEDWIKPEQIRKMQRDQRVEDCTVDRGWVAFGGLDFSMGDDLWAHSYLCINLQTGAFFADCDAWITQTTLNEVSIRPLYEKWIADGWLYVCPGDVIEPGVPIRRIMELAGWDSDQQAIVRPGVNFLRFGYDAYKSPDPINILKAWMYELGVDPSKHVVPVPQTNASFNQPVEQINFFVKAADTPLSFSMSPLWPWCFGNAVIDKDLRMENKKPVKRHPGSDACKVDPVQALCDALVVYNQVEGSERPAE